MSNIVTVQFRGAELFGFKRPDGVYVAVKPIVEAMGLDWSSQHKRLSRDPILSEGMVMMTIPFGRGGAQEAACLRLDLVNGWLFTIDAGRIKAEAVRERVLAYQRECYAVLAEHFGARTRAAAPDPVGAEPIPVRRSLVTEARQVFGVPAASALWFKLGLPTVPAMLEGRSDPDLFGGGRS